MTGITLYNPGLVENASDNASCFHACVQMAMKTVPDGPVLSFDEINKILRRKPGYYSWQYAVLQVLSQKSFEIVRYSTFDLHKFIQEPEKYLLDRWGETAGKVQIQKTDIPVVSEDIKLFLQSPLIETIARPPTIDDVRHRLMDRWYIIPILNAKVLNGMSGYSSHNIFVYGFYDEGILFHDPGLPSVEERLISWDLFESAWSPSENRSMIAIRKML